MKTRIVLLSLVVILLQLVLAGCQSRDKAITTYVLKSKKEKVRIGILPFDNITKEPDAAKSVTQVVISKVLQKGVFEVIELGEINKVMRRLRIRTSVEGLDNVTLKKLAQELQTELILWGQVDNFGETRIGQETYPSISMTIRLIHAKSGKILWGASATQTGNDSIILFDIGRISTLNKLCQVVVGKAIDSLFASRKKILSALETIQEDAEEAAAEAAVLASQTLKAIPASATQAPIHQAGAEKPPAAAVAAQPEEAPLPKVEVVPVPPNVLSPEGDGDHPPTDVPPPSADGEPAPNDVSAPGGENEPPPVPPSKEPIPPAAMVGEIGELEFRKILDGIEGFKIETFLFEKMIHKMARGTYKKDSVILEAKVVDYGDHEKALKFVQGFAPKGGLEKFEELPATMRVSKFGYWHLIIADERFGLMLRGPEKLKNDLQNLAKEIIKRIGSSDATKEGAGPQEPPEPDK